MNYWATSTFLRSAALRAEQKRELMSLGTTRAHMSNVTLAACHDLANGLPACTSIALVCSEDAELRRVYLRPPSTEDWTALERGGFFLAFGSFGFVLDALH